jgi:iron complex transport system substrate-binding protein
MKYFSILLISTLLFVSCIEKKSSETVILPIDSLTIEYAKGFAIQYFKEYKKVIVYSPWVKNSIYASYYLVDNKNTITPTDGTKILIPLKTIAPTSVTHFEFLSLLEELASINGVCSSHLIYNKTINEMLNAGKITDLGDAFSINIEKTLQLNPSALMMSGYNQNDTYAQRVTQAGIPVIFNNEWMETSLLARAEWIKFVAAFYDKESLADSLFGSIAKNYATISNKALKTTTKPNVMSGSNFRGTWYMPSGQNFMAKLYADAGAAYFYANDTTTGSLALNVETVLVNFSKSEVWLNCNFNSISDLINADSKHKLFKAVTDKEVYNFNKRMLPSTANDFWESAVARPDLILSDVIAILHPELLPNYELVYAEKLK